MVFLQVTFIRSSKSHRNQESIMPPKKNSANQPKQVPEQVAVIQEGGDPVMSAISIVDKKVRNLEKRRVS